MTPGSDSIKSEPLYGDESIVLDQRHPEVKLGEARELKERH